MVMSLEPPLRFVAPGAAALEVSSAGEYIVWHEHRTVFEGRSYRSEPGLPAGARVLVRAPDGAPLRLERSGSGSWSEGDIERRALGSFEAASPGRYAVSVEGGFEPQVVAVGRAFFGAMFATIAGAILLVMASLGGAAFLAVYGLGRNVEPPPSGTRTADPERSLRELALVVYILQAASLFVGLSLIGGVVINYLKRDEAAGTWLESHFRWQIRTFWWILGWAALGIATMVVLVGFLVLAGAAIWLIYRIARGWIRLNEGKAVP